MNSEGAVQSPIELTEMSSTELRNYELKQKLNTKQPKYPNIKPLLNRCYSLTEWETHTENAAQQYTNQNFSTAVLSCNFVVGLQWHAYTDNHIRYIIAKLYGSVRHKHQSASYTVRSLGTQAINIGCKLRASAVTSNAHTKLRWLCLFCFSRVYSTYIPLYFIYFHFILATLSICNIP